QSPHGCPILAHLSRAVRGSEGGSLVRASVLISNLQPPVCVGPTNVSADFTWGSEAQNCWALQPLCFIATSSRSVHFRSSRSLVLPARRDAGGVRAPASAQLASQSVFNGFLRRHPGALHPGCGGASRRQLLAGRLEAVLQLRLCGGRQRGSRPLPKIRRSASQP